MLGYPPDASEILSVIKGLNPDSAPGPDEFTGHFFLSCWDIIHADLVEMIRGFFLGDQLDKKITATSLVLIPKIKNTKGLSDFRPLASDHFRAKSSLKSLLQGYLGFFLISLTKSNSALLRDARFTNPLLWLRRLCQIWTGELKVEIFDLRSICRKLTTDSSGDLF